MQTLDAVALSLVAPHKGILAADESLPTIGKRFAAAGLHSDKESRRAYRELLLTTPGLAESISGVILFDETLRQKTAEGVPFVTYLNSHGILPGIKVDIGAKPLAGFPNEFITEGLDNLRERLEEYRDLGAKFTKWRAVISIGNQTPTATCLASNAESLARFAALSQEAGLVPIVEPEVLMDGAHPISQHFSVTQETLRTVFEALERHHVRLEAVLLKTNMILSGKESTHPATTDEVAQRTRECLLGVVPAAVPGVVFLSGGQSHQQATENLNAVIRLGNAPWSLSFSFGRALQSGVLEAWNGQPENVAAAQQVLQQHARDNATARLGMFTPTQPYHPA